MGLLYRWDLPIQAHTAANSPYPQRILQCKLQQGYLQYVEAKHRSEALLSFRSAPEMLLKPCKVHAVHVGTHVQRGKKQSCSFYVMLQRRVLLSNSVLKNGA